MATIQFGFLATTLIEEGRVTRDDIEEIRRWLFSENFPKLSDEQIVIFLNACCNVIQDTKDAISAYYDLTKFAPEVLNNRSTERVQNTLNVIAAGIMPVITNEGYAVVVAKLADTYYANFNITEVVAFATMVLNVVVYDGPPKGMIVIIDLDGVGLMHLTRIKLKILKVFFKYLQEALPVRLMQIHVFNTVYFIDKIMSLLKPFINQRVLDMLHFHPVNMQIESFYEQWLPKCYLPEDYGGDLPSLDVANEKLKKKVKQLDSFHEAEEQQRIDFI